MQLGSVTQADATVPVCDNGCRPLVQSRMHFLGLFSPRPVSQPSGTAGRLLMVLCAPETAAEMDARKQTAEQIDRHSVVIPGLWGLP